MSEVNDGNEEVLVSEIDQDSIESLENDSVDEIEALEDKQESDQEKQPLTKEEKKVVAELKKKLKLQVNGKEIEEEIDLNDDEKLRMLLQKGYAADSKFQEAAKARKEAEDYRASVEAQAKAILEQLEKDPFDILQKLGKDPDEYLNRRLQQKLAELEKSPEQKAKEAEDKRLKEIERREKELEEKMFAQQVEAASKQLEGEILGALQKSEEQVLPTTPYNIARIANIMEKGYSAQDAVEMLETEYLENFKGLSVKQLEKLVGQDRLEEMRKDRLAQKKVSQAAPTARQVKDAGKKVVKEPKKEESVSVDDYFANLEKNFK